MQPEEQYDVPFCDLCNTSVPLQDLELGVAVRHGDKTIGSCCLMQLRQGSVPAGESPAGESPTQSLGSPQSQLDTRLLPLFLVLLVAVAAATIWLDFRIAEGEVRREAVEKSLTTQLNNHGVAVQAVSEDLDGVPRRAELDSLAAGVHSLEKSVAAVNARLGGVNDALAQKLTGLERNVKNLAADSPDYAPALSDLRQQLQRQAATLAELLARPVAQAVPVRLAEPTPEVPGLPAALAHQVGKLADKDPAARFEAVDELLRSKDEAVLEHLLPMLKDEDLFVRRLTVEGLRDFRRVAVVDALLVSLTDDEDIVRDTAWRSLKEITGQKIPFEASASKDARARAERSWADWWEKNRASFGI